MSGPTAGPEYAEPNFPRVVGACIYCGAGPAPDAPLGDEHVVPYGLSGEWVLRDASCPSCADVTSNVERDVLRNALLPLRAKLGLRTRRKRERPATLPLVARCGDGPDAEHVTLHLPAAEHPGTVFFPRFPPAAALRPRASYGGGTDVLGSYLFYAERERLARLRAELGAATFTARATFKPAAFARTVAKIGYAFAVACVGLDALEDAVAEVPARPVVLGHTADVSRWVGGDWSAPVNPAEGRHAVTLTQVDGWLTAFVRLFAGYGAPEYHAVVARLR